MKILTQHSLLNVTSEEPFAFCSFYLHPCLLLLHTQRQIHALYSIHFLYLYKYCIVKTKFSHDIISLYNKSGIMFFRVTVNLFSQFLSLVFILHIISSLELQGILNKCYINEKKTQSDLKLMILNTGYMTNFQTFIHINNFTICKKFTEAWMQKTPEHYKQKNVNVSYLLSGLSKYLLPHTCDIYGSSHSTFPRFLYGVLAGPLQRLMFLNINLCT